MKLKRICAEIFFLVFAAMLAAPAAEAQEAGGNPRIALVIGNATYRDEALATTANDAGLVAQTLQAAGFDVVGARDLDGQSLRAAMRDFLDKAAAAGPDMQAFVYLAGRAVQYNGDNYFVPIDAQINRDADVPIEAVRISDFAHALAATPGKARIIVLDAARASPYPAQGAPLAPGLALVDPEPGELIAFNAAPGTLAGDEQGPYGVYGKTLAGALRQGGVDIAEVFDQTRVLVNAATEGALLPWSASKLDGPYFVFERAADSSPPPALSTAKMARRPLADLSPAEGYAVALQRDTIAGYLEFLKAFPHSDQARRVRAILAVRREAAFWRHAVDLNTPRAYWTYLSVYPKGPHVADAHRRLAILSAEFEPPQDFRPEAFVGLPPPPPDERFYEGQPFYAFDDFGPPPPPPPIGFVYVEDDDWRDLPPPPPPVSVGVLPVLGVAIPLVVGAVAYHGYERRNGIAPRGARRLPPPPLGPPPMPAHIKPAIPRPPIAGARPPRAAAVVKPLPPIGPAPGAKPIVMPAQPAAGKRRPVAPGGNPLPIPLSPKQGHPPIVAPAAPGLKPLPIPPPPSAGNPALRPRAPTGAQPLPTPAVVGPGNATAPRKGGAHPPIVPGTPRASPGLAVPPAMSPKGNLKPPPKTPAAPTPLRAPSDTPVMKPKAEGKPPAAAPHLPLQTPRAAHTPAPAIRAPAPVMRAPAPVMRAPAPVMRAPAPVMRAPAPVMRAPAPVMRAPAPAMRAPRAPLPAAVHAPARPACGRPGLPVCPK